jgi:hypothetical protein
MMAHRVGSPLKTPHRPGNGPVAFGAAAAGGDPMWEAFAKAYTVALRDAQQHTIADDQVSECVVELVAARAAPPGRARTHKNPSPPAKTPRPAHVEERGRRLASKLLAAFDPEAGGLPACLALAERSGGFDRLRDRLEQHGFTRVLAWRLCLAFRRAGLLRTEPNRPYLDSRGVEVTQRLLAGSGVPARSVRDWEAALMLEADSRLALGAYPAKLDAEIVAAACARLAGKNGAEPRRKTPMKKRATGE